MTGMASSSATQMIIAGGRKDSMRGWTLDRIMCPKNCAQRDRHVHRVRTAEEVHMPLDIWDRYQNHSAYYCSYCDAVWFQGHYPLAVVVGLYRGKEFEKFP